jgi:hypothetical protein
MFVLKSPIEFIIGIFTYIFSFHEFISNASLIIDSSSSANISKEIGRFLLYSKYSCAKSLYLLYSFFELFYNVGFIVNPLTNSLL